MNSCIESLQEVFTRLTTRYHREYRLDNMDAYVKVNTYHATRVHVYLPEKKQNKNYARIFVGILPRPVLIRMT